MSETTAQVATMPSGAQSGAQVVTPESVRLPALVAFLLLPGKSPGKDYPGGQVSVREQEVKKFQPCGPLRTSLGSARLRPSVFQAYCRREDFFPPLQIRFCKSSVPRNPVLTLPGTVHFQGQQEVPEMGGPRLAGAHRAVVSMVSSLVF